MTKSKNKSALFIGSSTQSLPVARVLQAQLKDDAMVNVWDQGIFGISEYTLDCLLRAMREFDFGVFVFSADDTLELQGQRYLVARDNVVLELGIFAGGLGRERTFMVVQELPEPLHLPTDLQGITTARFSWSAGVAFESNYPSLHVALGPATQSIREAMSTQGAEDTVLKPLSAGMIFLALWLGSRRHSVLELEEPFRNFQQRSGRLGPGDKPYAGKAAKYACQCLETVGIVESAGGNEYSVTSFGQRLLGSEKLRQRFSNAYEIFDELIAKK